MKTKIVILVLALCTMFFNVQAQHRMVTTTRAMSNDISDNLDLDAVASIFGDSENLEDFEHRLNDPDNRISNLDLNEDGYIDYLRVIENSSDRNSLVVIQAVLGDNVFQDVATIEVERVQNGNPRVQIVGDPYIYGSNYIIEPAFVRTPLIFSFFWGPRYSVWNSPYYWNNYPRWYSYYRPYSPFKYRRHIYSHINYENRYHHADSRNIQFSGDNYNHIRRNDYATRYPNRAFENRHEGVKNRIELEQRRPSNSGNDIRRPNEGQYRNDRQIQRQQRPERVKNSQESTVRERRRPVSTQPSNQESTGKRINSNKNSSVSTGKSDSGSDRNRSNSRVRSNQKNEKKSESTKKESRKDSRERR